MDESQVMQKVRFRIVAISIASVTWFVSAATLAIASDSLLNVASATVEPGFYRHRDEATVYGDLNNDFDFNRRPRKFVPISAPHGRAYFLHQPLDLHVPDAQ